VKVAALLHRAVVTLRTVTWAVPCEARWPGDESRELRSGETNVVVGRRRSSHADPKSTKRPGTSKAEGVGLKELAAHREREVAAPATAPGRAERGDDRRGSVTVKVTVLLTAPSRGCRCGTVMLAVPAAAMSAAGTVAVRCVAESRVVARRVPFQRTTEAQRPPGDEAAAADAEGER